MRLIYKPSIVARMRDLLDKAFMEHREVEAIVLTDAEWWEYVDFLGPGLVGRSPGAHTRTGIYFDGIPVRRG